MFASFYYYGASLGSRTEDGDRVRYAPRGDRAWLLGYTLLLLVPSLVLVLIKLLAVGSAWFALWLGYVLFVMRNFSRVRTD